MRDNPLHGLGISKTIVSGQTTIDMLKMYLRLSFDSAHSELTHCIHSMILISRYI